MIQRQTCYYWRRQCKTTIRDEYACLTTTWYACLTTTRDDSDDDSIARYTPRSLSTTVLIRRYHIRSILYNYDYRSACRVWLTLSSCLHDVMRVMWDQCILLCTSHTLHTLYHYSWRQWRRQYRVTTRPILHTDIWTMDIPYRRSVDAWRRSSIPYAQLRINPSVRSSIQRRSIIGRSRRSSIESSSGSDLLNGATFFANVSRSPFRVSLTHRQTDRQNIPNFA